MGDIIIIGLLVIAGAWALFSCLRKRGCSACPGSGSCSNCSGACCKRGAARCHNSSQSEEGTDSKPPNV